MRQNIFLPERIDALNRYPVVLHGDPDLRDGELDDGVQRDLEIW